MNMAKEITRAGARTWRTAHKVGWVPRHQSGRMRGDTQPGARQQRGIQPGHRLQGDGDPPTDQGTPGVVDGDGRDRPHEIGLGAPEGADLREGDGFGYGCAGDGAGADGPGSPGNNRPTTVTAQRGGFVSEHMVLSPRPRAALTDLPQ
jgi:hypothetical protein